MQVTARRAFAGLTVVMLLGLLGCGGDDDGAGDTPEELQATLDTAGERLQEAASVRFTVESDDIPDSGTVVVGAEGVAVPPSSFEGTIRIKSGALPATVDVVSIDGELWAQLPMTQGFEQIQAAELGVGDPGKLISADEGVSQLLKSGTDITAADQVRIDGDVYNQIQTTLPGELIGAILAISDPDAEIQATWTIDPDSGQLRQATLTGPFYEGGDTTYTVQLEHSDESVDISAPTD